MKFVVNEANDTHTRFASLAQVPQRDIQPMFVANDDNSSASLAPNTAGIRAGYLRHLAHAGRSHHGQQA